MTDEKRIERLLALANKAWPDAKYPLRVHVGATSASVFLSPWGDTGPDVTRLSVSHANAAEALESALCVLAGEPSPDYYRGLDDAEDAACGDYSNEQAVVRSIEALRNPPSKP